MNPTPLPDGYVPHTRRSPLTEPWEPLYARQADGAVQLAVLLREAHCNGRGFAHGGLISALADNAMGLTVVQAPTVDAAPPTRGAVTLNLALDFIARAEVGEWLEIRPVLLSKGRSIGVAECRVVVGERLVARGNATFKLA